MDRLIAQLPDYPEGEEKQELVAQTLMQMKRSMAQWNINATNDMKILDDLRDYTRGAVEGDLLMLQQEEKPAQPAKKQSSAKKKKK